MNAPLKAVVLIGPSSDDNPRHSEAIPALAHVANRPILHHVLDGLIGAEVDGVIVAGAADSLIDVRGSLARYAPPFDGITYAVCNGRTDVGGMLSAAAPLVGDAACVIQCADGLLDQPVRPHVELLQQGVQDVLLFVSPDIDDDADEAKTSLGCDGQEESVLAGQRTADFGVLGHGVLRRASDLFNHSYASDLTMAGQLLAGSGARVRLRQLDGWCRYRGNGRDLLELNRIALDRLPVHMPLSMMRSNRIEGRVLIDPTATVRDSTIVDPVVIGAGATVLDAYIGPYTSTGAAATIECAEIERSIVYPEASVTHVGGHLILSLVGRRARVFRDFSLPRAMRLWVGEGDEVALC